MINYIPAMDSLLWSRKCQRTFQTLDDLKRHIADQRTAISRYIGKPAEFHPDDVEIHTMYDFHPVFGLKNCYIVKLAGRTIGYCGE